MTTEHVTTVIQDDLNYALSLIAELVGNLAEPSAERLAVDGIVNHRIVNVENDYNHQLAKAVVVNLEIATGQMKLLLERLEADTKVDS